MKIILRTTLAALFIFSDFFVYAQIKSLRFDEPGALSVKGIILQKKQELPLKYGLPLFSVLIDSNFYNSFCGKTTFGKKEISFVLADSINGTITADQKFQPGIRYTVRFTNNGKGNHKIENLVPLGEGTDKVYITAGGTKEWPHYLCRSLLYRPGFGPVGVILPDNAWHLGFSDFRINDTLSLTALARRDQRDKDKSTIDRWSVTLKPGGWVEYNFWFDIHTGDWHDGLKMMFAGRYLYDLPSFDNRYFERKDLQWMKSTYLMLLQFAWDKKFYDARAKKYNFYTSFSEYDSLTGGYDIFTLWPTWPRLGLDQRNQWDMYRDLPGGLAELKKQADFLHNRGKKYFISYNPWDENTRKEDQLKGMEELLRASDADGVVLDTRGSSSKELQAAADKVKPGIIMYSEGMAVPKDMPGIVAGRVHDALVLPPPLNLNKLIKPDFAIFRVLQLADDRIHRELAISFFNGYGVEINTMRPGRPSWIREEYAYLGKTTKILRENNSVFHNSDWMPLIETLTDSIYVNRWMSDHKILFTIYSLKPEGFNGALFELSSLQQVAAKLFGPDGYHAVDLWNHSETDIINQDRKILVPVSIDPFDRAFLGTRREGSAGCIALLPKLMKAEFKGDSIVFSAEKGDSIRLTAGEPTYRSKTFTFSAKGNTILWQDYFDITTEKVVLQLFGGNELFDERILQIRNDVPVLISGLKQTKLAEGDFEMMKLIPEGTFRYYTRRAEGSADPFITLPDHHDTVEVKMHKFYIDKYPVTNRQWLVFVKRTRYEPHDTTNYLKHWVNGYIPEGQENFPVVYIGPDDVKAFAKWAGKRLPTEMEWQYAAQGNDLRKYPWGNSMDSTKCNYNLNHPTAVDAWPQGASPFGVEDLIGNVWQMTADNYDVGSYYYMMIRGGSYYHPASSPWYVTGGPVPADHPEMLLLMAPGLDRNATVGFRLAMDAK
ncbi:MAG: SUMF1/EgtB/PvdO family nonheme iron enzyme [Bacteroidetes bacterium]|nr:SUMF1/EgtB/PvdO family nonheme iron enzyme [Bacteroidota bacterium]